MTNLIVTTNVSVLNAGAPSTLQRTGAFASVGGTTLAAGATQLLQSSSDLATYLAGALSLTSLSQSAGLATATAAVAHTLPIGNQILITIAGATPSAYNGTHLCTITTTTAFTFAISSGTSSPATGTIVYTLEDVAELVQMNTTFWAQGSQTSVYLLEVGEGSAATAITALGVWIAANPGIFYAYLVPRGWAGESTFFTFLGGFENPNSKTYFCCTATNAQYTSFTSAMKCAIVVIEDTVSFPATEFSAAAPLWDLINTNPSSTTPVAPFAFRFEYGVTPIPPAGNGALLAAYKAAHVNVIGTGAEGGLSNTILFWGTTMDGNDISYWYSVDWVQINETQALANEVINGSNNQLAPLYYDQAGINRLQARAAQTLAQGITYGLVNGQLLQTTLPAAQFLANVEAGAYKGFAVINAEPFLAYVDENPGDYDIGKYAGLTVVYTPARGFTQIVFNIVATDLTI